MPIPSNLLGIILALSSALAWGSGDFGGGLAARKNNQYQVLVWSSISGLIVLLGCALIWKEGLPPPSSVLWGALAGIMGAIGMAALYRGLSLGHTAVVAPLSAVIAVILPVGFDSFTQGYPGTLKMTGFGLALLGVWGVAQVKSHNPGDRFQEGIGLACLAGIGFGGFFILIAQFQVGSVFIPLVITRSVSLLTGVVLLIASRVPMVSPKKNPLMLWVGVLDVTGNILYVLASRFIRLDMVVVLASLYPAATVLWARFILKEKISFIQWVGIILCLTAIILISA